MDDLQAAIDLLNKTVLGKKEQIKLALTCMLAGGHLLLEDLPGIGKTTLAVALARVLGCSFARIQFTSDLLPADVLGGLVYHPKEGRFFFRPGPIFNHVVLVDEINRATPKAQSALLEAMEEKQVSIEGDVRTLPEPFFVIATQNPLELYGTFPLPESQLDRFFMRLSLGYPPSEKEILIIKHGAFHKEARKLTPVFSSETILALQKQAEKIHIHEDLLQYIMAIVSHTRHDKTFRYGLSPRGAQALVKAAKTYAFIERRDYVIPEDIKHLFLPIAFHRLIPKEDSSFSAREILLREILNKIPLPA
jgi:MoxR-like ATPase